MISLLTFITISLGSACFIHHRLFRYLRYFQQEDYSNRRFLRWLCSYRAFDRKGTLVAAVVGTLCFLTDFSFLLSGGGGFCLWILSKREENPQKEGKRLLHMTPRALRLHQTSLRIGISWMALCALGFFWIDSPGGFWFLQVIIFQCNPLFLIFAKGLLQPSERKEQQGYMQQAKKQLEQVSPYVIGITGSYGKTSTKDALGQILQITKGPTFWPSKGVNTPMGITREIREHLKPGHAFAVIEMAAYGKGSIERICHLTPPHAAIITTIGTAHLERFGSQHTIYLTKSELALSVPYEGILVCNGDDPLTRQIGKDHAKRTTLLYGMDSKAGEVDCWVSKWKLGEEGTHFTLHWKGNAYEGFTKLQGKTALSNLLAAFTMACALGSDPAYVLGVIRNLAPVDNRLELRKEGGVLYVRDAYNSNPIGFASALDVMASLPAERRVLMTPGMIELGALQREENEKIGRKAGSLCHLALVVGSLNKEALSKGLQEGGMPQENIVCCETRQMAFETLAKLKKEGDAILIENDLPDLYESIQSF